MFNFPYNWYIMLPAIYLRFGYRIPSKQSIESQHTSLNKDLTVYIFKL